MEETTVIKKKLGIIPKILLCLLCAFLLLLGYAHFIEPKIIMTHEYAIVDSTIPDSFNGFKIVHFSDIHFGRTTNEKEVTKVIHLIQETKPDLVLFTGDLFDSYITLSEENKFFLKTELSKIEASLGKYAILGDSDYLNLEAYKTIMNEAGFVILQNKNIPIFYKGTSPILLSGISSLSKGEDDYTKALEKPIEGNYYQIVLSHEPIAFSELKNNTNLVLSGHSLGGLIRLPFLKGIISKNNVSEYQLGKFTSSDTTMYVSNGIGTEDFGLRFANFPSLNLYRLYNF